MKKLVSQSRRHTFFFFSNVRSSAASSSRELVGNFPVEETDQARIFKTWLLTNFIQCDSAIMEQCIIRQLLNLISLHITQIMIRNRQGVALRP